MPVAHDGCSVAVASKVFLKAFLFTRFGRERTRRRDRGAAQGRRRLGVLTLLPGDVHEAVHHALVLLVCLELLGRGLHLQQQLHPLDGHHRHLGDGGHHAAGQQVLPEGDGVTEVPCPAGPPWRTAPPWPPPLLFPPLPEKHAASGHLTGFFFLKS